MEWYPAPSERLVILTVLTLYWIAFVTVAELENRLERAELRVTQQQNRVAATEAKLEKKRAKKKAYKAQLLEHSKQAHAMKLRSATMKISEGKLQRQLEREKAALDSKIASAVSEASKGHEVRHVGPGVRLARACDTIILWGGTVGASQRIRDGHA